MTSLTKNLHPPTKKFFFRVQSTRLADPFEPLNSSLAQLAGGARALVRQLKTAVFFCENRQNHPDAKVLMMKLEMMRILQAQVCGCAPRVAALNTQNKKLVMNQKLS